mmetsp:Transcript_17107/g.34622  ORF Transcript_17107/g.34622 Transcript_17107/m.34622 type:complete len:280 (-) Transcript_17107:75-914(-)
MYLSTRSKLPMANLSRWLELAMPFYTSLIQRTPNVILSSRSRTYYLSQKYQSTSYLQERCGMMVASKPHLLILAPLPSKVVARYHLTLASKDITTALLKQELRMTIPQPLLALVHRFALFASLTFQQNLQVRRQLSAPMYQRRMWFMRVSGIVDLSVRSKRYVVRLDYPNYHITARIFQHIAIAAGLVAQGRHLCMAFQLHFALRLLAIEFIQIYADPFLQALLESLSTFYVSLTTSLATAKYFSCRSNYLLRLNLILSALSKSGEGQQAHCAGDQGVW